MTNLTVNQANRNYRRWFVISYDIPDNKRRYKVMKILEGYGFRAQYSVFECEIRPADLARLEERLKAVIDEKEDDVRFYPLCENCMRKTKLLGKATRRVRETYSIL